MSYVTLVKVNLKISVYTWDDLGKRRIEFVILPLGHGAEVESDRMSDSTSKKILILAANPKNSSPLRLDEEVREIDAGLTRARKREQFELEQKWACSS
jgi:hypothetical protein